MNDAVRLILSLSLSGSILALIILAIKPFIKHRLSRTIQYYIWLVVLLRLLLPFSFENSAMNNLFYRESIKTKTVTETPAPASDNTVKPVTVSPDKNSEVPDANIEKSINDPVTKRSISIKELFATYSQYLWLAGAAVAFLANLLSYLKFSHYLKKTNTPAKTQEAELLSTLTRNRLVRLYRNRFISTPLLIGIVRPKIIIPDMSFNEIELKNILLHELTHLKRFDIGIKWLTMLASSVHWFNPFVLLIKKEINTACELSCDEEVIKNFDSKQKQSYGDTLISVVSEHRYPSGVLQATMCEEKQTLKERLTAIMTHRKRSTAIILLP